MIASPNMKKVLALVVGMSGLVASSRELETSRALAGFKPTGFYTGDIGFFTVKPWGPATWSVDFNTKSVKKLNELLYSAEGKENRKGSILCTDELCQGHGKATTAVLTGTDGCVEADLEIAADAFEVCFTCPPGEVVDVTPFADTGAFPTVSRCTTDETTTNAGDCSGELEVIQIPFTAVVGSLPTGGRTACVQYRDAEEPMPNIVKIQIKYTCVSDSEVVAR